MRSRNLAGAVLAILMVLSACGSDANILERSLQPAVPTEGELVLIPPTPAPAIATDTAPEDSTDTAAPESTDTAAEASPVPLSTPTVVPQPGIVEILVPEIIATYPHDNTAYTQGLEIFEGDLLESTGRQSHPNSEVVFESDLRRVEIDSGTVIQRADLPGTVFGEGLTRVDDELVQITWQDEVAYFWDADSFELLREVNYGGRGWGLCFDGQRLVMTDGSDRLFFRDPVSFELIGEVAVTNAGAPVAALNELECIDDKVWANVYRTDLVVRVDPGSGVIEAIVDATVLEQPRIQPTEVLNGLAWDATTETWLMTGKFWSTMYRVRFVPGDGTAGQ